MKTSRNCNWSRGWPHNRWFTRLCLFQIYYYKTIAIDLSKEESLDADPKVIQQINFTGNPNRAWNATMFFIIEEAKETILNFSQGTVRVLNIFCFNVI